VFGGLELAALLVNARDQQQRLTGQAPVRLVALQ
jgi:hypothetical protein